MHQSLSTIPFHRAYRIAHPRPPRRPRASLAGMSLLELPPGLVAPR